MTRTLTQGNDNAQYRSFGGLAHVECVPGIDDDIERETQGTTAR